MTDEKRMNDANTTKAAAAAREAKGGKGKRSALKARVAAVGIGTAAMAGLVANMEVAGGQTPAAAAATSGPAPHTAELAYQRLATLQKAKAARPIVLTPHVIVHTVGGGPAPAVSSGSGYVSSGYVAAPAPAPRAAAPVASSGGSRP